MSRSLMIKCEVNKALWKCIRKYELHQCCTQSVSNKRKIQILRMIAGKRFRSSGMKNVLTYFWCHQLLLNIQTKKEMPVPSIGLFESWPKRSFSLLNVILCGSRDKSDTYLWNCFHSTNAIRHATNNINLEHVLVCCELSDLLKP